MTDTIQIYFPFREIIDGVPVTLRRNTSGINLYGVWSTGLPNEIEFGVGSNFLESASAELRVNRNPGEEYSSFEVELLVREWPDDNTWVTALKLLLEQFVDAGAVASWCGGELCSPYPNIIENISQLYAAYCPVTGFVGNTSPRIEDLKQLDRDSVEQIQEYIDARIEYARDRLG